MNRFLVNSFKVLLVVALILIYNNKIKASDPERASELLNHTFSLNNSIESISVTMLMKERVGDEIIKKKSDFKVDFDPYQVYIKQYYPNTGKTH